MTTSSQPSIRPCPKPETFVNKDYENFIRKIGCIFCGSSAQAHHVRRHYWGAGIGQKPHSYVCIPLCPIHHDPGAEKFIEVEHLIIRYMTNYCKKKGWEHELIDCLIQFIEGERGKR